jgi:hypothetical protein
VSVSVRMENLARLHELQLALTYLHVIEMYNPISPRALLHARAAGLTRETRPPENIDTAAEPDFRARHCAWSPTG